MQQPINKIVLTGGGSAGHVIPNLALIDALQTANWTIDYIGSSTGIERKLIRKRNIRYHSIASGKLRRYFSWQNFIDPFKIVYGIVQSFLLLRKLKPNVVFSKGGFVSFPVVLAAWLNNIPAIIHESDATPGLANRLSFPFCKTICVTFPEAKTAFKDPQKVVVTGTPLRASLFQGDKQQGKSLCHFNNDMPVIMLYAGGSGSVKLNQVLRESLPKLLPQFNVIHLCGKGNLNSHYHYENYKQLEYADEELPDLLAAADIVIARSGANSLYELLALKKPHILIPLPRSASRGDQILNAKYYQERGLSQVLWEEALNTATLINKVEQVFLELHTIVQALSKFIMPNSNEAILELFNQYTVSEKINEVC